MCVYDVIVLKFCIAKTCSVSILIGVHLKSTFRNQESCVLNFLQFLPICFFPNYHRLLHWQKTSFLIYPSLLSPISKEIFPSFSNIPHDTEIGIFAEIMSDIQQCDS